MINLKVDGGVGVTSASLATGQIFSSTDFMGSFPSYNSSYFNTHLVSFYEDKTLNFVVLYKLLVI